MTIKDPKINAAKDFMKRKKEKKIQLLNFETEVKLDTRKTSFVKEKLIFN